MNEILKAALTYVDQGFAVLPVHGVFNGHCTCPKGASCKSPGKHPRLINGVNGASKDREQVQKWFTQWPNANIAIATGAVSGIMVVDIDGVAGEESIELLSILYGDSLETVEQVTGGGGRHLLFRHPGVEVKNKVRISPGLDIRGDGGYIVVSPSVHVSGKNYLWKNAPGAFEVANIPQCWLEHFQKSIKPERETVEQSEATIIPEGQRDDALFKQGCSMWERGVAEAAIRAALYGMNETQCSPPLPKSQVEKIIKSIIDRYTPGPIRFKDNKFSLDDFGLGERFVHYSGDHVRYCKAWGTWLLWDGRHWKPDETGEVEEWGRQVIRRISDEAASIQDEDLRAKVLKFAAKCCHRHSLENMLRMAQTMPGVPVTPEELDRDIWSFNCTNGTLDLRTGQLRQHNQADLITKMAPVHYDPGAQAPIFLKFLSRIFDGNTELISFVQKAAGYSLTGSTAEQVLFLCHGFGANGKSTLLNVICEVVGKYGSTTPMNTFIDRQAGAASNDIARMKGLRLITALETNKGGHLDEGTVKQLTGGDLVTARFLHREFFDFLPTFKFWLGFNHKPVIKGTDLGIWRRIRLIPFTETIADSEKDKHLPEKLRSELSGILAWMVQGCLEWQQGGLKCPSIVETATSDYRSEMDLFGDFLKDSTVTGPELKVRGDVLYRRYQQYCWESGLRPVSAKRVVTAMKERGFQMEEARSRRYLWIGIDITPEEPGADFLT